MCRGMPEWVAEVSRGPLLERMRAAATSLLLVLSISIFSRTTFPLPRNVLLRPCLRCTSSSARTPFAHLVDNLVRLPPQLIFWARERLELELCQTTGYFLLLGTHPGFLYPVSSWCCLPRHSSPAQDACPHAMLFGHFVLLSHFLIHSHCLTCRYDLGASTKQNRSASCIVGPTSVPPVPEKCPSLYTERCPSLSYSAKVMAVSRGSQLEPVIIGHAPHCSLFLNGPPPMRSDKHCVIQALLSPHFAPICAE